MRILTVFPWLLTDRVQHGGAIYALNILRQLACEGHPIYLANLSERSITEEEWWHATEDLRQHCTDIHLFRHNESEGTLPWWRIVSIPSFPSTFELWQRFDNRQVAQYLEDTLKTKSLDVVLLQYLPSACFIPRKRFGRNVMEPRPPFVIHDFEVASHKVLVSIRAAKTANLRWRLRLSYQCEVWVERHFYRQASGVIVFSPQEREHIVRVHGLREVYVVSPVVRVADFPLGSEGQDDHLVVFTGSLYHQPNVDAVEWFCRSVLPLVTKYKPDVKFVVVCTENAESVEYLRSPQVEIVCSEGSVTPWLARAAVVVSPVVSGSGVRIKNLAAFSAGRALVTTSLGSQGLAGTPGTSYLIADEPDAFAAAVVSLLEDRLRRAAIGKAARVVAERWFDVPVGAQRLINSLDQIITRSTGRQV